VFPAVFRCGTSTAAAANPLLDSDNDNPATPNAGTAFLGLFRFDDCLNGMVGAPYLSALSLTTRVSMGDATAPQNIMQVTKKLGI
jgi:hypothetical protein